MQKNNCRLIIMASASQERLSIEIPLTALQLQQGRDGLLNRVGRLDKKTQELAHPLLGGQPNDEAAAIEPARVQSPRRIGCKELFHGFLALLLILFMIIVLISLG